MTFNRSGLTIVMPLLDVIQFNEVASEYFQGLTAVPREQFERNFVFFLGSTIGNQDYPNAGKFLRRLWDSLNDGDYVMIGFDLMKNPKLLYNAYNDAGGVFSKIQFASIGLHQNTYSRESRHVSPHSSVRSWINPA